MSKNNTRLFLLDFSNTFYRQAAAHTHLSHNGQYTGGVYGFFKSLTSLVNTFGPGKIIACCDRRPYLRSALYAAYKQGRKRTELDKLKALEENSDLCVSFLESLGVQVAAVDGLEADDLIALFHEWHGHRFSETIAVSNDSDLFQLLSHNFSMYRGQTSKARKAKRPPYRYKLSHFFRAHPLLTMPSQWVEVLARAGTHNAVKGIEGVGPAKAMDEVVYGSKSKFHPLITPHKDLVLANQKLIELPFPDWRDATPVLPLETHSIKSTRQTVQFLARYGIQVQAWHMDALDTILESSGLQ